MFHNPLIEAMMWGVLFGVGVWIPVWVRRTIPFHWKSVVVATVMYSTLFLVARRTVWGPQTLVDEIGDFVIVLVVLWFLQMRGAVQFIMPPLKGEEWGGAKILRVATLRQRMEIAVFSSIILLLLWRLSVLGSKSLGGWYIAALIVASICLVFRLEVLAYMAGLRPQLAVIPANSNLINRGQGY